MDYAIGAAAGLGWGIIIGLVKHLLCWSGDRTRHFSRRAYTYMIAGGLLNIGSLLAVYFLRHWLPFSYEAALVGAAAGLALCSQLLSLRLMRKAAGRSSGTAGPTVEEGRLRPDPSPFESTLPERE